jgi:hypothetical protein
MKWFRRNQLSAPNLTPHTHLFDSDNGCEEVRGWVGSFKIAGHVLYCSCGCWKIFSI